MNKLLTWLTAISHPLSNTPICQHKCSIYALVVIKLNLMFCTIKFSKLHFKKCFDPKIANFCFRQRSNERFTMFISSQYSSCLTHQPPLLQFHLSERFIKTLFKRKLGLVFISKTSKTVVSNSFRQLAKKARLKDFDILPCSKERDSYQFSRFAWATLGGFLLLTANAIHFTSSTGKSCPDYAVCALYLYPEGWSFTAHGW